MHFEQRQFRTATRYDVRLCVYPSAAPCYDTVSRPFPEYRGCWVMPRLLYLPAVVNASLPASTQGAPPWGMRERDRVCRACMVERSVRVLCTGPLLRCAHSAVPVWGWSSVHLLSVCLLNGGTPQCPLHRKSAKGSTSPSAEIGKDRVREPEQIKGMGERKPLAYGKFTTSKLVSNPRIVACLGLQSHCSKVQSPRVWAHFSRWTF